MKTKLLALLSFSLLMHAAAQARPDLTQLNDGDVLEISFESRGCFHHRTGHLRLTATLLTIDDSMTVPVTRDMLEGLDLYFHAIELGIPNGCTTTNAMHVRQLSRNGHVSEWTYVDASCRDLANNYDKYLPKGTDWSRIIPVSRLLASVRNDENKK